MSKYVIVNGELYHWGIPGQKRGLRRFQYPDGSLTPEGRKRYLKNAGKYDAKSKKEGLSEEKRAKYQAKADEAKKILKDDNLVRARNAKLAKKKAVEEAEAAKKREAEEAEAAKRKAEEDAKRAEEEKARRLEEKDRVLREGSATEILQFRGEITSDEMKKAIDRLEQERKLVDISAKEIAVGKDKMNLALVKANDIMNNVDKIRDMGEKAKKAWNLAAEINNSVNDEFKMPILDGGKSKEDAAKAAAKAEREKHLNSVSIDDVIKDFNKYTLDEKKDLNTRFAQEKQLIDKRDRRDEDVRKEKRIQELMNVSMEDVLKNPNNYSNEDIEWIKKRQKILKDK